MTPQAAKPASGKWNTKVATCLTWQIITVKCDYPIHYANMNLQKGKQDNQKQIVEESDGTTEFF